MPEPTDKAPTTARPAKPDETDDPARTKDAATGGAGAGETPHTLGPYRILKELGRGAMGVVYHAHHDFLHGDVALKVMDRSILADPTARERFLREARAAFRLRHENVVEVYDAAEVGGEPYIAMQLLAGQPLDKRLKDGPPLPMGEVLRVVRQTALGLSAVHALGMIHRDLKPANLWLEEPNGRVKVLDFGLVKQAGDKTLTQLKSVLGTPLYMSPEQANSQPVDARSDLFSLGSIFYELCTGARPFGGDGPLGIMIAIYTKEPRPVREANPAVPEPVADLIHTLLAKDPAKRVKTAAALAERIAAIESGRAPTTATVPPPPPPPPPEPLSARLAAGRITIDELLALKASGTAESDLWLYSAQIWPIVKGAALNRSDVRNTFSLLLGTPDNALELWDEAQKAMRAGDATAMGNWLNVVRETAGPQRAYELLTDYYNSADGRALPLAARDLLHAARELYARFAGVPAAPDDLLGEQKQEPEPDDEPDDEPDPFDEMPPPPPPPAAQRTPLQRLRRGEAVTVAELLELKEDPLATYDLRARADTVFQVLRRHLHRPDVCAAFRDLLAEPDRQNSIWNDSLEALLEENFRRWDAGWAAVREIGGREQAARRLERFVADWGEAKLGNLPAAARARVRAACADAGLRPTRALLVPCDPDELAPLLAAPPEHAAFTAFVTLAPNSFGWLDHIELPDRGYMRACAKAYLYSAPPDAIGAYLRAAREYLDTDSHFVSVLLTPYSADAARLFALLLERALLKPKDWRKLFDSVGLAENEWGAFLLEKNHLSQVLVGLGGDGTGADVWQGYLNTLSPALVSADLVPTGDGTDATEVTAWERKVHAQLKRAADALATTGHKLARALPAGGVNKLIAANNLVKWVADPASAERDGTEEVQRACEVFEMKPFDLARAALLTGGYQKLDLSKELPKLAPLLALFRTAYPCDVWHGARSAVTQWLRLSQEVPERSRALFQSEFVLKCVPPAFYRELFADARQVDFEPLAVVRISKEQPSKSKPARKGAEPEPQIAEAVVLDDDEDELPAKRPQRKRPARSRERDNGDEPVTYKKKRTANAGYILWVAIGIIVTIILALRTLLGK